MSDADIPNEPITVTGNSGWGYNLNVTDRGTGETERRWIDDRNESVKLDNHKSLTTETDLAADAELKLRGNDGNDVMMVRPLADTNTRASIEGRDGNDTFAITTRDADQPMAKDAPRPQVNIDGGAGTDTLVLAGVPSDRVLLERTGDTSYKITDGTGTDIHVDNVEFLKGPSRDTAAPAAGELPRDTRGVDLEGLKLEKGEGMLLSDAEKPLIDARAAKMESQTKANRDERMKRFEDALAKGGDHHDMDAILAGMKTVRATDFGAEPTREAIAPENVPDARKQIENTRGQEGASR